MAKDVRDLGKLEIKVCQFGTGPEHYTTCDSVFIRCGGKEYRLTAEFDGIKLMATRNVLSIKPVVGNVVVINQSDSYGDKNVRRNNESIEGS